MLHFIVNSVVRKAKRKKVVRVLSALLDERGAAYTFHFTERRGHAGEIAKALSAESACDIIVVGGDGTLHEVLNGIGCVENVTLGLIPCGTGNDFAAAARIPESTRDALGVILAGNVRAIDYIAVGEKRSINAAGMGMDVDVLERCYRGKMQGKGKYLFSLLQSVFLFKGYRLETEWNGVKKTRNALFACVCNGRQIGGGIRICPVAEIGDGKLDVVVVDCLKKGDLFKALLSLLRGKLLELDKCEHVLCDKVFFRPLDKQVCQLDGELYQDLPFAAEKKSGLKFFLP